MGSGEGAGEVFFLGVEGGAREGFCVPGFGTAGRHGGGGAFVLDYVGGLFGREMDSDEGADEFFLLGFEDEAREGFCVPGYGTDVRHGEGVPFFVVETVAEHRGWQEDAEGAGGGCVGGHV